MNNFTKQLDDLYVQYGYEPRNEEGRSNRVYLFTKSIYNGADIINIDDNEEDIEKLRNEYFKIGYAVKVRKFESIEDAEETLFKDFFKAEGVIQNLKRRYEKFVQRMMVNLPENSNYKYINTTYDNVEYNSKNDIRNELTSSNNNLIKEVVDKINSYNSPLLVIIEAAAGYGKTCTAYEILNSFISLSTNKLPFFTELSRDRKASIFKHILAFEIEEQFSNRVDSKVVIEQIKKGRIPLIIDGFDELISKDFTFSSNDFDQVENMLSTIVDLLTDKAKILITSRKTAIFDSEEFHNWMLEKNIDYTLQKITISEPKISDWLSEERLGIITSNKFPVQQIANPVLLTYLRYVKIEDLKNMIVENQSIVDKYFDFLLKREQERQRLLIEPDTQLEIFRNLVRLFTEWDIKSENKDFIKEIFLEYDKPILEETRKKYTPESRPRIDQLADILSNHAFLDRKNDRKIGIINEFVFGSLIGHGLILGEYKDSFPKYNEKIPQYFALIAVQSFQVETKEKKEKLWEVFNEVKFNYDPQFFFRLDVEFKNEIIRNYKSTTINDFHLNNFYLKKEGQFESVVFTNCTFRECIFSSKAFVYCFFINCRFFNCNIEEGTYSRSNFELYQCNEQIGKLQEEGNKDQSTNLEKEILSLYFKKGSPKPQHRQLSKIKKIMSLELKDKDIDIEGTLHNLQKNEYIQINGDLSFLTRKGINYYNKHYKTI